MDASRQAYSSSCLPTSAGDLRWSLQSLTLLWSTPQDPPRKDALVAPRQALSSGMSVIFFTVYHCC
jgi:hypothetical protein